MLNRGDPVLLLSGISLCKAQQLLNYTLDRQGLQGTLQASLHKTQVFPSQSTGKGWFTGMQEHEAALCSRVWLPPSAAAGLVAEERFNLLC